MPKLSNGIGIDVRRIVEARGLRVALVPNLTLGGRTLLAAYVPEYRYVLVERNCYEPRQRFSMAHELGHAELEDDFGPAEMLFKVSEAFLCIDSDADLQGVDPRAVGRRRRREIRANQFAARLLRPDGLVRAIWSTCHDIREGSSLLGVSMESLRYRAEELGLVST